MKLSRRVLAAVFSLAAILTAAGCNRAVRDGVALGLTEGISDGLSQVISEIITNASPGGEE